MEFFAYWLATVIASFIGEIANELRIFKDAAKAGYKINLNETSEEKNQILSIYNKRYLNSMFFKMLLPLINVIEVYRSILTYNNNKEMMIKQLYAQDTLEIMSDYEKAEWQKKPTTLNAFVVPIKYKRKLEQATTIKTINGEKNWEMTFELGYEFLKNANKDDIIIFKARGAAYSMSDDERRKEILKVLGKLLLANDLKSLLMLLFIFNGAGKSFVIDMSEKDDKKEQTKEDNSTKNKMDILKKWRDELLNESSLEEQELNERQIPSHQKTMNSKNIKYVKKRKR